MDILLYLMQGFEVALTPTNVGLTLIGCVIGTFVGAMPGLGPSNGVAILIPLVFSLGFAPAPALILLTSVYYGAMYGGRISSILLNIPGDEPAMMTTIDGYPMALKGKGGEALVISGIASFCGGLFATIGLLIAAPGLAGFALMFGPAEYFVLFTLTFSALAGVTSKNRSKAIIAASFGLALAMIGIDGSTGQARFTFGEMHLLEGIDFLVAIVGLFAIAEVLLFIENRSKISDTRINIARLSAPVRMIYKCIGSIGRGSGIGFIAGILPGAGASLGSFIAYTIEKRISDSEGTFGHGDPRGVAAPEAGNNASAGGALVPMLTLGVPGSGTTAVLLAILMALNITPGPLLFQNHPDVVWGLIAALFIANIILLIINVPLAGIFSILFKIPSYIIMPAVAVISFVGVYSISGSTFDILLMTVFGVIGYIFRKLDVPTVPVILGILLGNQMEDNLRRSLMISGGDFAVLWSSYLAIGIWILTIVIFVIPYFAPHLIKLARGLFNRSDVSD